MIICYKLEGETSRKGDDETDRMLDNDVIVLHNERTVLISIGGNI